ncbi:alpha/beta hydrolase [Allofranklinella schreckenbergeri]|uniref:Alpha/beta hydrolase n=1 Tax=Allofranklinella schreckenbergeri TaxID=1076744 RepID=A0A3M6QX09_9BURK|nr:alpha/beta hydrolase [Allofranklinella schreckenbergeri]RMX07523.1 alpha/beta hydrolase [Allofranklinella schreckenbergeri]
MTATSPALPRLRYVHCPGASKNNPNGIGHAQTHRMAYWDWTNWAAAQAPESAPGNTPNNAPDAPDLGHLIVCVHGLTRNGRDFDALAARLARRARVVCPDVAGRGQSDWLADPAQYQVPQYVNDMLALLGQLVQEAASAGQPITRLDWIGTSMGGLIGMGFVTLPGLPIPISRLVLNDVGPALKWSAIERIGQYLGKPLEFASEQEGSAYLRQIAAAFGPHTDAQWQALSRPQFRALDNGRLTLHYDPAIAHIFQTATAPSPAAQELMWNLYDAITAPTLLLRGQDSDLLSPATAQAMTARGPKAQLIEFPGVGHAPTLVQDEQIRAVEEFLFRPQN